MFFCSSSIFEYFAFLVLRVLVLLVHITPGLGGLECGGVDGAGMCGGSNLCRSSGLYHSSFILSLRWRHNGRDGFSNHQPHDCLLTGYSGADQRKHQSSASLAFVRGIHRGPVNSLHKWPVTRKMFPFDDVIMFYDDLIMFCIPSPSSANQASKVTIYSS